MLLRARGADIRAYDKISGAPGAENPPAKKRPKSGESKDSAVQNGKGDDGSGESEDEDTERLFWTEVGGHSSIIRRASKYKIYLIRHDPWKHLSHLTLPRVGSIGELFVIDKWLIATGRKLSKLLSGRDTYHALHPK